MADASNHAISSVERNGQVGLPQADLDGHFPEGCGAREPKVASVLDQGAGYGTQPRASHRESEEALRVATRRMEEGLSRMVEVLDAETTWTRLGAGTICAQHGYYRTLAVLARSVGLDTQEFIVLIESAGEVEEQ